MPKDPDMLDLKKILTKIESRLESIEGVLSGLDKRITTLEKDGGTFSRGQIESPLMYSRVLMGTLDAIKDYETDQGRGIVAKELARLRELELPTIYDHLSQLETASLVFWQRGTELGLKPFNAKFYSVSEREELLSDLPVLMALPDSVTPIAQAVLNAGKKGIGRTALIAAALSLREQGDKNLVKIPAAKLPDAVDEALQYLQRRVLIRRERAEEDDIYSLREN